MMKVRNKVALCVALVAFSGVGIAQGSSSGTQTGGIQTTGTPCSPAMDRIARMGLRYTQFHSTALCSPSRAAIITGRNHHNAGILVRRWISHHGKTAGRVPCRQGWSGLSERPGRKTAETAAAISEYSPDGWTLVLEPESANIPGAKSAKK